MKIKKVVSRLEVYNGKALKTGGGLMKKDLMKKNGKVISKRMSNRMRNRSSGGFLKRIASVFDDKQITKQHNLNYIKGSKSYNFYNKVQKGGVNNGYNGNSENSENESYSPRLSKRILSDNRIHKIDFKKYSFYKKGENSVIIEEKEPNMLDVILELLEKSFNLCPIERSQNETKIEFTRDIIQNIQAKINTSHITNINILELIRSIELAFSRRRN